MTSDIYRAFATDEAWPVLDLARVGELRADNTDLLVAARVDDFAPGRWPAGDRKELARRRHHAVARELAESDVLTSVLAGLSSEGIRCIVLKGAAVARTHYHVSWTRIRADIDLLVPAACLAQAETALAAHGWRATVEPIDPAVSGQRHFVHARLAAPPLDLHVRLLAPVLPGVPAFDELWRHRRALPGLDDHGWTLADADALWYACVHIALHHTGDASALWLCDLDRIARGLSGEDWARVSELAARTETRRACGSVLQRAAAVFGTPLPAAVAEWHAARGEPSFQFLSARSELEIQWLNLRALPGWRARAEWLRAHLLPDRAYMRARYGARGGFALAAAYTHRAVAGVARWVAWSLAGKR